MNATGKFVIKDWRYDGNSGELVNNNTRHQLNPQQRQLLQLLITHAPEVVDRDAITEALWPDRVVNEDAISRLIAEIRKMLGERASAPHYIKTIPKKGYQLIAPVENMAVQRKCRMWQVSVATVVLSLFALLILALQTDVSEPLLKQLNHAKKFTATAEREQHSQVSPEGQFIAYVIFQVGMSTIRIDDLTNSQRHKEITVAAHHLLSPTWIDDQTIALQKVHQNRCSVWVHHLDNQTWLEVDACHPEFESRALNHSAANNHLYYSAVDANNTVRIKSHDLETQTSQWLTNNDQATLVDTAPSLSDDGKQLAFTRGDEVTRNIWVLDLASQKSQPITEGYHYISSLAWYDNSHLIFDSDRSGYRSLWFINTKDKAPKSLAAIGGQHPSFSQDKSIMTYQQVNYEANIWLADAGSEQAQQIIQSNRYDNFPVHSPDGRQFVYSSNREDVGSIWRYDLTTGRDEKLISVPGAKLTRPIWRHDGQAIFVSANSAQEGLFNVVWEASTQQVNRIQSLPAAILAQHQFGQWYYLLKNDEQQLDLIIQSEKETQQIRQVDHYQPISKDCLLFSQKHNNTLWEHCLSSGTSRPFMNDDGSIKMGQWQFRSPHVYYIDHSLYGIWQFNPQNQTSQSFSKLHPNGVGGTFSIHPNLQSVLLVDSEPPDADIMIHRDTKQGL